MEVISAICGIFETAITGYVMILIAEIVAKTFLIFMEVVEPNELNECFNFKLPWERKQKKKDNRIIK